MVSPLSRFLGANRRLSGRYEPRVESTDRFYREYDALVVRAARELRPGSAIVDLGGGRHCPFAAEVDRSGGTRIVAVDISEEELDANETVDEVRVADVAAGLPFEDGEVSLLVSRTLLEHVEGVPAAVGHIGRVIAPGGRSIHLVPCRSSLFAIAARLIPWRLAKPAVDRLVPSARGVIEFEPFYDHCEPATLERLFRDAGFSSVDVRVCWSQADYFQSIFPLFLAVWGYQALLRRLGVRRLAAYAIVEARR
jgi:ubiquinone/menaquinone biosynthesis C-methylase UbiE